MRMNNVEVHMNKTNEWRFGDIVMQYSNKGFICEVNKDYYTVIWDWEGEVNYEHNYDYDIVNLSAIGRKAALASSKKVGRDSKGRFKKKKSEQTVLTVGDKFTIDAINLVDFIAFGGGGGSSPDLKKTKIPEKTATEVLFWHRENTKYLESLEKRIEALEMKQPKYQNCGGAGGCNHLEVNL